MDANKINIGKKLPTYKAPEGLLEKIEVQLEILDQEQSDSKLSSKLPEYKSPDIFENIAPPPKFKRISFTVGRIAASVLLIVGLTFVIKQFRNRTHTQIVHSYEIGTQKQQISINENLSFDSNFATILGEKCKTKPGVCKESAYEDLYNQLQEIKIEEQNLREALKTYKSPEIETHLVRITNDKIKIENYLLKLFS